MLKISLLDKKEITLHKFIFNDTSSFKYMWYLPYFPPYMTHFPPLKKYLKILPCTIMSKGVKMFHEQKYLANYRVWPITCSVFLGGKYCMSNFHKQNG